MIIPHYFGIGLREYSLNGRENEFPMFERCPDCLCVAQGNLHRNGYYWRYGIDEKQELLIPICRLRCLACKVNISILPFFLIPYFQYTVHTLVDRIHLFLNGEKVEGSRQLLGQHVKRFLDCQHWIHSYFVELGHQLGFSRDLKKEALKYMKMIRDIDVSSFFRRSWGHLSSYFMGTLILPYSSNEKHIIQPT